MLTGSQDLRWTSVMASKCLHFIARAKGIVREPPVPIDGMCIVDGVWPEFKEQVTQPQVRTGRPILRPWKDATHSFAAYNRYMTAIIVWARQAGWKTTEMETTIFDATPVSYAQAGLLPQFQRDERDVYENIRLLAQASGRVLPEELNVPNKYLCS